MVADLRAYLPDAQLLSHCSGAAAVYSSVCSDRVRRWEALVGRRLVMPLLPR